ncbi:MAG TPA: hypothetical protein VMI72_01320 [Roseiarcus sp.]|nr:hypothetical protein [Roseiarcus sp.]
MGNHSWVRIPPLPPLQSLSGHGVYAKVRHEGLEQPGLRSDDPHLALGDLDPLGERAEMVAAVAAAFEPDALARGARKAAQHLRRHGLAP